MKTTLSRESKLVTMPVSLCKQIEEHIGNNSKGDRIFPYARQRLYKELKKWITISGVADIRLHDLRHSHVSLSQGYFWDSLSDCLR